MPGLCFNKIMAKNSKNECLILHIVYVIKNKIYLYQEHIFPHILKIARGMLCLTNHIIIDKTFSLILTDRKVKFEILNKINVGNRLLTITY